MLPVLGSGGLAIRAATANLRSAMAVKHDDSLRAGAGDPRSGQSRSANTREPRGYRVGLEETLPPMPLRDLLSAGGANIFVLSADHGLLEVIQHAAGEQYPVFLVEEWAELDEAVESGRCGIALVDADFLGERLIKRIESLERHAKRLVTLVAADRLRAQDLIGLLSERKIHRLLIKPPAPGITRLLIESAVSRCIQLRESAMNRQDAPSISATARTGSGRAWRRTVVAALGAVLIGALVVGYVKPFAWLGSTESTSAARPTGPATPPAAATVASTSGDRFGALVERAEKAFREGRLAEPAGDNALDYYLTILAADPNQDRARDRLSTIVDALFTQAETDLLNDSLSSAAKVLDQVRRADPSSPRLAFLDAQLARARTQAAQAAREAPGSPTRPTPASSAAAARAHQALTELDGLLTIAAARLEQGLLLEPQGDSARAYTERASELVADDPRVTAMRARLAEALVAQASTKLAAGDLDGAADFLVHARELDSESDRLVDLEARVGAARARQAGEARDELMARARERLRQGALVRPAGDSAFGYLSTLRSQDPGYPGLREVWTALEDGLAAHVTSAIEGRRWDEGAIWLDALRRVAGPNTEAVSSLSRELRHARLQEQYLATAVPASELTLLSYAPPTYPTDAQRAQIEGWVELEFIVGQDGEPREIVSVGSQPAGRFEQAAIAAVAGYRYRPFEQDGEIFERRVKLRIKFELE